MPSAQCRLIQVRLSLNRTKRQDAMGAYSIVLFLDFLFHNIHACQDENGSCESGFIKMSFCRKGAALPHKGQQLTSVFDHIEWGREANLSLDVCFFLENWKKAIVCVALLTGCGKSDKDGKSAWLCHTGRGGFIPEVAL